MPLCTSHTITPGQAAVAEGLCSTDVWAKDVLLLTGSSRPKRPDRATDYKTQNTVCEAFSGATVFLRMHQREEMCLIMLELTIMKV